MLRIKTTLQPSAIHGLGCFAAEDVAAGQLVWQFDPPFDVAVAEAQLGVLPATACEFLRTYGYRLADPAGTLVILCGDHARHMNHSTNPNVVEDEVGASIAARDIPAGEELTCDYFSFDEDAAGKAGQARSE